MDYKLDENMGLNIQKIFKEKSLNFSSVYEEKLNGFNDELIFEVCAKEKKCLLAFDKDFSDIKRFPPKKSSGVVVFRLPKNPSLEIIIKLIKQFISEANKNPVKNNLWIVEPGKIRIKEAEDLNL